MKIAFATEDGNTISQHFGMAPGYLVATIETGQVTQREMRAKPSHQHGHHGPGQHHGGPEAAGLHASMAGAIADCQLILAGGMGRGAYLSLKGAGIEPVLTDIANIDEALRQYLAGTLQNRADRLH